MAGKGKGVPVDEQELKLRMLETSNMLMEALENLRADKASSSKDTTDSEIPGPSSSSLSRRITDRKSQEQNSPKETDHELSKLFNWKCSKGKSSAKRASFDIKGKRSATGRSKVKTSRVWTHSFLCLSKTNSCLIPDSTARATLKLAGLGEKRIILRENDEFIEQLIKEYPKLKEGGGFELLRASDVGAKELIPIEMPVGGYSLEYLKAVMKSAKIYVRPLQRDLDESPENIEGAECHKEVCFTCGESVEIHLLKDHVLFCQDFEFDYRSRSNSPISDVVIVKTEEKANITGESISLNQPAADLRSLKEIVAFMQLKVRYEKFMFIVDRGAVLKSALQRMNKPSFTPNKDIEVSFIGESGCDTGGLKREFFTLVKEEIAVMYLESSGILIYDESAYEQNIYFKIGQLIGMAFIHGGLTMNIFAPSVYDCMIGKSDDEIAVDVDLVGDTYVRNVLSQISDASSKEDLRAVITENSVLFLEVKLLKPLLALHITDKKDIIQSLVFYHTVQRTRGLVEQLCGGLQSVCSLLDCVKANASVCREFFVNTMCELTTEQILNVFKEVNYSVSGSNNCLKERQVYMLFVQYLDENEKGQSLISTNQRDNDVTLQRILSFFSGSESIPIAGYGPGVVPKLHFNHSAVYPTASTCGVELTLPIVHEDFMSFKKAMDFAILNHGGFGLI